MKQLNKPFEKIKKVENANQIDLENLIKSKYNSSTPKRTHYLLYDSFYRADSIVDLGSCETNNTAYTYADASSGVKWGISGNSAYTPSFTTASRSLAYQQVNESDGILEADVTFSVPNKQYGLSFRITDINNFIFAVVTPSYIQVAKYVAGAVTNLATVSRIYTSGKFSVLMKGSKIEIYMDGFLITRFYDTFNMTATNHGLYCRGDDTAFRWDNLCFRPLGEVLYKINEDFETNLSKWYWNAESAGQSYSQTFNTSIKESGTKSFRVELRKDDLDVASSKRCEITLPPENPLEEHWYGVSIYLPNGGADDYAFDPEPEILIQWHTSPDSGEENVSPPLSLQTVNGKWRINQVWDARRMSVQATGLQAYSKEIGDFSLDKGRWVNWVFHIKWGWLADQEPITEVYKDGILVFERNGLPNCMNDSKGVYQKLGVYKWVWKDPATTSPLTKRVVYYDNFWTK